MINDLLSPRQRRRRALEGYAPTFIMLPLAVIFLIIGDGLDQYFFCPLLIIGSVVNVIYVHTKIQQWDREAGIR